MQKHFTYKETDIVYNDIGQGNAVVLLHGFGEDGSIWHNQADVLAKEYRVIVPDLPGSGKSGLLNYENVVIEDYAACLKELLINEKIEKCILLGHSMGGYITLAFAEKYTDMLCAFGLIHSTAFADNEEKKEARRKSIDFLSENDPYSFLKTSIPNLFSEKTKKEKAEVVAALIQKGRDFSREALIQYYTAMMNRQDKTAVLSSTRLPVLFVMGTEDKAAPMEDVLKQVHLPAIAFIHILTDVGHMGMLENSVFLNKYLLSFCRFVNTSKVL